MMRYSLLAFLISLLSCTPEREVESEDWILDNSETIEYLEVGDQKIQIVYSTLNIGGTSFLDTSIVVQVFRDTLLLEEIQYQMDNGDSIKSSHLTREFNANGLIINEIDSVNGGLRSQIMSFYENGKIQRSENLFISPDYNDAMGLVGTDTTRTTVICFYDDIGNCIKSMALRKDEMLFRLTGLTKYDTTLTFSQFDKRLNETGSVSLVKGDTTSVSRTEYDAFGRDTAWILTTIELGTNTLRFEYDERGNETSELLISGIVSHLIRTEYDKQNRPIVRNYYRPKNAY